MQGVIAVLGDIQVKQHMKTGEMNTNFQRISRMKN